MLMNSSRYVNNQIIRTFRPTLIPCNKMHLFCFIKKTHSGNFEICQLRSHHSYIVPRPQRRQGERRNRSSFPTFSAGVYTPTWLVMVTLSLPAAVSKHEFSYRNKNTLSFVMVYSALFHNVLKL